MDILISNGYKYNDICNIHTHKLKQMINKLNNEKMLRKFASIKEAALKASLSVDN